MFDKETSNGGWGMAAMVVVGLATIVLRTEVPNVLSTIFSEFMNEIRGVSFGTMITSSFTFIRPFLPF